MPESEHSELINIYQALLFQLLYTSFAFPFSLFRIFTEREYNLIRSLTMKKLLIAITNIRDEDISDTPFIVNDNMVCPQPFQLSELYMDDCTGLGTFDYYVDSNYQIPLIWGLTFLYVILVILVLFLMAAYSQHRRAQIMSAGRRRSAQIIEGTDVTGIDGETLVFWELKAGLKSETRPVSVKFGPAKRLVLYHGDTILREIDLRNQTELTIQKPFDDNLRFVVKLPHEYDIVLRVNDPMDRTVFIEKLQGFLNDLGIGYTLEEPMSRHMMKRVFTKRDRQRLLENFFKAVFHEGSRHTIRGGEVRKDILECELNREEFADAMSLKKDSLFVEQMFQLVDQDGNGFISFREFVDMTVIFAKGSPEDKIRLMFNMYDIDGNGSLDREEFKKMLKAMMEIVNASVSSDQMERLIESMFAAAGFQNKQELTLEDFNVLLRDHKEELSTARLNITGFDVPEIERKKSPDQEGEEIPVRYRARETAPARARRTVVRAYGGGPSKPGASRREGSTGATEEVRMTHIPVEKRKFTQTKVGRMIGIAVRWIENYKLHIFYLSIFWFVTAGIFVERAYYYSIERENTGFRRIAGYGVSITRGAASAMMFTYSVLIVTMARNFITYLRETIFNNYVPFDSYINFHKIVALTALVFTFAHCVGHGFNFYHIPTQTADDLTCIFREVYHRTHILPKFDYWLFLTVTGKPKHCERPL